MEDPKDEVLILIGKSRIKSQFTVKQGRQIQEWGQYVSDLADAGEKVIECASTASVDWQLMIASWRKLNQNQDTINEDIDRIPFEVAEASASTATFSMLSFADPDRVKQFASPGKEEEARVAAINLGAVIDRLAEKQKALALLREFGLSSAAPGENSPADLLEAACGAFEKPVTQGSPSSTSLIPMRECIIGTLAKLLPRRPKQEPAKSQRDKILSIGQQLARTEIEDWTVISMADQWKDLIGDLSGSKQKDITREECRAILRRAMVFLIEFLQSLDRTRMK